MTETLALMGVVSVQSRRAQLAGSTNGECLKRKGEILGRERRLSEDSLLSQKEASNDTVNDPGLSTASGGRPCPICLQAVPSCPSKHGGRPLVYNTTSVWHRQVGQYAMSRMDRTLPVKAKPPTPVSVPRRRYPSSWQSVQLGTSPKSWLPTILALCSSE